VSKRNTLASTTGYSARSNRTVILGSAAWPNYGPLPYQPSSRVSDLLALAHELLLPSVYVRLRSLAGGPIVTQLVTLGPGPGDLQARRHDPLADSFRDDRGSRRATAIYPALRRRIARFTLVDIGAISADGGAVVRRS
jgi:hypothetical protein